MGFVESGNLSSDGGRRRAWRLVACCAVALIAAGYLWFVRKNCSPYASNSDASGYLNCTRLLLAGGDLRLPVPRIAGLGPPAWNYYWQEPLGYRVFEDGTYAPMVSVGYPLHLLVAAQFVGIDWSAVAVSVFVAGGAGAMMVLLGRQFGLPWAWALAGVALLWASPLFVYISLQPMSDIPATLWVTVAVAAAWQARGRWAWGFAAGAAVAIAVLVRPTDALVILPVAVALGWRWRAWVALGVAGLPGAAFLFWYNAKLYGAGLASGYGDMSWAFGVKFVPEILGVYAKQLPVLISPLVVAAALALPWAWRGRATQAAVLVTWIGAFMGFYAFCQLTGMSWSMRYVLPAFPPLIVAALWVVHEWTRGMKSAFWRRAIPVGALGLALAWDVAAGRTLHVVIMKEGEVIYRDAAEWLRTQAPAKTIVVAMQATGALTYYTSFPLVRFESIPLEAMERVYAAARANGQEVYAVLFEPERERAFREKLHGQWAEVGRIKAFSIWKRLGAEATPVEPRKI